MSILSSQPGRRTASETKSYSPKVFFFQPQIVFSLQAFHSAPKCFSLSPKEFSSQPHLQDNLPMWRTALGRLSEGLRVPRRLHHHPLFFRPIHPSNRYIQFIHVYVNISIQQVDPGIFKHVRLYTTDMYINVY